MKRGLLFVLVALGAVSAFLWARTRGVFSVQDIVRPVAEASGDAQMGRRLFVTKSCVTCHQVRDVGGRAAPPLDVIEGGEVKRPADFIAGMWRGAPIMVELQRLEIGYQIDLSGDELLHLAAFASDPSVQGQFSLDEVPVPMRELFLDEVYVITDDLEDFYERYEGEEWYDFSDRPHDE